MKSLLGETEELIIHHGGRVFIRVCLRVAGRTLTVAVRHLEILHYCAIADFARVCETTARWRRPARDKEDKCGFISAGLSAEEYKTHTLPWKQSVPVAGISTSVKSSMEAASRHKHPTTNYKIPGIYL